MKYFLKPPLNNVSQCNFNFNSELGRGGYASVFKETISNTAYAVKKYHTSEKISIDKISYMIDNCPIELFSISNSTKYPILSWPLSLIRETTNNEKDLYIGYIMPLVNEDNSQTLDFFYDFNLSKRLKYKTSSALSFKIEIIINICETLDKLHQKGFLFIDLKPQNLRVFEGTNIVSFLDCDSFKIIAADGECLFPAEMVSSDYISPEVFKADTLPESMTIEQDLYALAVIIFQILNNGIHPFQGILSDNSEDVSTNDRKAAMGLYPYGLAQHDKIKPNLNSIHNTFLPSTRSLFDQAFTSQNSRPTAAIWRDHFDDILKNKLIVRCPKYPNDIEHMHFKDNDCPKCQIQRITTQKPIKLIASNIKLKSFGDIEQQYSQYKSIELSDKKSIFTSTNIIIIFIIIAVLAAMLFGDLSTYIPKDISSTFNNTSTQHQDITSEHSNADDNIEFNKPTKSSSSQSSNKAHTRYLKVVYNTIMSNLNKKGFKAKRNLSGKISFFVNDDGSISNIKIYKSSGSSSIDYLAQQAVILSSPLSPPPENMRRDLLFNYITAK
jgi:serine/threonine protein kinase